MPTVDLPGMRSISTDSACIARHRSSARPVTLLYFTPASGLNSNVVTTGPGWIWTTEPSTENSRHFSSSSRADVHQLALVDLALGLRRIEQRRRRQREAAHATLGRSERLRFGQRQRRRGRQRRGASARTGGVARGAAARPRRRPRPSSAAGQRLRRDRRGPFGRPYGLAASSALPATRCPSCTCLAITSRRCLALRRSSRQRAHAPRRPAPRPGRARRTAALNSAPNENCVARITATSDHREDARSSNRCGSGTRTCTPASNSPT